MSRLRFYGWLVVGVGLALGLIVNCSTPSPGGGGGGNTNTNDNDACAAAGDVAAGTIGVLLGQGHEGKVYEFGDD